MYKIVTIKPSLQVLYAYLPHNMETAHFSFPSSYISWSLKRGCSRNQMLPWNKFHPL